MWKFTNMFFASFVSHSTNHSCFKCFNEIYVIYKFMCSFCFFQKKGLGNATHPGLSHTKRLRNFVKKQSGFGHQSRGGQRVSVPGDAVTHGYHSLPSPRDLGRAEEKDAGIQCG